MLTTRHLHRWARHSLPPKTIAAAAISPFSTLLPQKITQHPEHHASYQPPPTLHRRHFKSSTTPRTNDKDNKGVKIRSMSAGLPDWIEEWNRDRFRKLGYGLGAVTTLSGALFVTGSPMGSGIVSGALALVTAGYWHVGLKDIAQPHQTIRRNFPVLGNVRYLLEMIRPEIRQYFVESDSEAVPFSREQRSMVYRRAKGMKSVMPFGTRRNVEDIGYEWINHSLYPTVLEEQRVLIGKNNPSVTQPYSASLLNISAMSYGALSDKAILSLSSGGKLGGFYHNTGEGGISQFHKEGGADLVWNIGTGYFGCGKHDPNGNRIFDPDLFAKNATHAKMIEIKLSQGAKPAHGGMLPKEKITKAIADARDLPYPATMDCDSPAQHSAFSNPTQLCEFIAQLRSLSGGKPVGLKLSLGLPEEFTALVHAFLDTGIHPDFITVDGAEGGTGAAPNEFSNHVGVPSAEALSFIHAILVGVGLRDPVDKSQSQIALIGSGKVTSGFDMYKKFALGADVCAAARAFMFSLGCIQALKCGSNTCPTGIATQDPELSWGLDPTVKSVRVANFHWQTVHSCIELMQATGVHSWSEIQPHFVCKRVAYGQSRTLNEIYDHLSVKKGELLEYKGPQRLVEAWDLDDGIVVRAI